MKIFIILDIFVVQDDGQNFNPEIVITFRIIVHKIWVDCTVQTPNTITNAFPRGTPSGGQVLLNNVVNYSQVNKLETFVWPTQLNICVYYARLNKTDHGHTNSLVKMDSSCVVVTFGDSTCFSWMPRILGVGKK